MKDLEVITDALRDEGKKWLAMSDSIAEVKTAAEQLHLEPSAFFIGDASVVLHAGSYRDFHTFMVRILCGAVRSSIRSARRCGASPTSTTGPTRSSPRTSTRSTVHDDGR